jgi:hypothetical protein
MSKSSCSTVIKIDNSRNVNILSNNTLKDIKVVVDVVVKGVQFIFHTVKYKLNRYKSRRDLYLFEIF